MKNVAQRRGSAWSAIWVFGIWSTATGCAGEGIDPLGNPAQQAIGGQAGALAHGSVVGGAGGIVNGGISGGGADSTGAGATLAAAGGGGAGGMDGGGPSGAGMNAGSPQVDGGHAAHAGGGTGTDAGWPLARGGGFGSRGGGLGRGGDVGPGSGGGYGFGRGGAAGFDGGAGSRGGMAGVGGTGGSATIPPDGGAGGSTGRNLLVPDDGIVVGMYYGDATIAATQQKLGRALPLHLTYYAWSDDFTQDATAEDLRAGRVPLINWELFDITLDAILNGSQDTLIQRRARGMKQLAKPVFLDFGAEMNGDWSPWGGAENGRSADKYLSVYRKVHDAFVAEGADNVIWAWCPNVTDEPREAWNEALDYYPGDAYVDWVCVDGYNWGNTNGGGWQSFAQVFAEIYPKLASKNKPILIGEMASAEAGGDKAAWIDAMLPTLKQKYPAIRGLVWFDVNKETDWRIGSSSGALAAFKRLVNDPYANP